MQRGRRRVKRQRNEAPKSAGCYHFEAPMSDIEASLECQEGPFTLEQSPNSSHMDRQSSDASTSTAGPLMPLPSMNMQCQDSALWGQYIRQVYIGNSHCPIDGWYQACRSATYANLYGSDDMSVQLLFSCTKSVAGSWVAGLQRRAGTAGLATLMAVFAAGCATRGRPESWMSPEKLCHFAEGKLLRRPTDQRYIVNDSVTKVAPVCTANTEEAFASTSSVFDC